MKTNVIYNEECLQGLRELSDKSVNMCVTSPPYWGLRDYGEEEQLGLEDTPEEYVERLVDIFSEVKRVLKDNGTLWLNLGDTYNANYRGGGKETVSEVQKSNKGTVDFMNSSRNEIDLPTKNLVGIPWRVAFALQKDGWYLRNDIIWHKPNPMPESVKDRCTTSHEHIFLLAKSKDYYFNQESIKEPTVTNENRPAGIVRNREFNYNSKLNKLRGGHKNLKDNGQDNHSMHKRRAKGLKNKNYKKKNKRDVWKVNTKPFSEAHFAVYPPELIRPCVKAGCPNDGIVLDPFMGAGTTALVALQENKNFVGFELNKDYINIAYKRLGKLDKSYYNQLPEEEMPAQQQLF